MKLRDFIAESDLRNEFGDPVEPIEQWDRLDAALLDPAVEIVSYCAPRQQGKSVYLGATALRDLFTREGARVLLVAASLPQAKRIFQEKFARPIATNEGLRRDAKVGAMELAVPRLNSTLEVVPANVATATGRSITLLILDEAREIDEELFGALLPSIRSTGGKILLSSTAGRPSHWFKNIVFSEKSEIFSEYVRETVNPTKRRREGSKLDDLFLEIFPRAYEREVENRFVDLQDAYLPTSAIEGCVDVELKELPNSKAESFIGIDIAAKKDLTSLVVLVRSGAESFRVARIEAYRGEEFPDGTMDQEWFGTRIDRAFADFPNIRLGYIDSRHDASWLLQQRSRRGWGRLKPLSQTARLNMELFGMLAEVVRHRRVTLLRETVHHKRLLDELMSMRIEEFSAGGGWRVVDGSKRLHRDISVSLSFAVRAACERTRFGLSHVEEPLGPLRFDLWKPETVRYLDADLAAVEGRIASLRAKRRLAEHRRRRHA